MLGLFKALYSDILSSKSGGKGKSGEYLTGVAMSETGTAIATLYVTSTLITPSPSTVELPPPPENSNTTTVYCVCEVGGGMDSNKYFRHPQLFGSF